MSVCPVQIVIFFENIPINNKNYNHLETLIKIYFFDKSKFDRPSRFIRRLFILQIKINLIYSNFEVKLRIKDILKCQYKI